MNLSRLTGKYDRLKQNSTLHKFQETKTTSLSTFF